MYWVLTRKTTLLHIKFMLWREYGSRLIQFPIHMLFREREKEREREREREKEREKEYDGRPFCTDGVKYGTIVHSSPTRDPGAWPPAAVAAAVTLEIRDSQDRRNIAGRKPTKRGPRQCHPVSGSRHDCFNTLRFCSVSSKRQPGRALKIYSNVCESRESDREMCFWNVNIG